MKIKNLKLSLAALLMSIPFMSNAIGNLPDPNPSLTPEQQKCIGSCNSSSACHGPKFTVQTCMTCKTTCKSSTITPKSPDAF